MNHIDISVIICCYNSAKRLPTTLEYLAKQKVNDQLIWEIILVDNNSTDTTAEVALAEWRKHNNNTPFTIVKETTPGLSNARKKGVNESKGEIILFCDDDNWLQENYVTTVYKTMQQDKEITILGGIGEAVFEGKKPEWFDIYYPNYAVGIPPSYILGNKNILLLYGAGLSIRKSFFTLLDSIEFKSFLSDRTGKELTSGGDTEYCLIATLLDLKVIANTSLTFKHLIPQGRETLDYLKRWHYGFGKSRLYIYVYYNIIAQKNNIQQLKNLRFPYWFDQSIIYAKEILNRSTKVLFLKNDTEKLNNQLKIQQRKGEIAELCKLKNNYFTIHFEILELVKKGKQYLQHADKSQNDLTELR